MTTPTESISVDIIASKVKFWLIVILSLLLILTLIKKFNKFAQKIPTLKNYELVKRLIGSAGLFFKAILGDNHATFRFMVSFYSQFKDTPADIFLGLLHLVYIDKPDDIQVVLNNSNALDKGGAYRLVEKYFGNGLITASADKWKKTRRLVAPYFGTKFMESNFNEFNSHNSDFVEKMRIFCDTHEYVDLWKHVSKLTLTIVWELVLGKDMDTTQQEKDIFLYNADKCIEIYGRRMYKPWFYSDFIFNWYISMIGGTKYFEFMDNLIKQTFEKVIQNFHEKLKYLNEHGRDSETFSYSDHYLLKLNEEGIEFSDEDLKHEGITMIAGGYETSALTTCYTLMMLAMNPEIQEKVYREIIKCSGEDLEVSKQQISEMVYLEQCIKETLRIFPPVPVIMRKASDSFKLSSNYTVQKNSNCIIPIFMVHRNPNIFPNPMRWNPDNFAADQVENRHKYSYLAFSGGPRACIGGRYAITLAKMLISKFLKTYRVETDQTIDDIKLNLEFVMRSAVGYKIKMYTRMKT